MNLVAEIPVVGGKVLASGTLRGNLEFKNVVFSYPSRPEQVLNSPPSTIFILDWSLSCALELASRATALVNFGTIRGLPDIFWHVFDSLKVDITNCEI